MSVSRDEISTDEAAAVFRRAAELDLRSSAAPGRALDLAALEQAGLEAGLSRDAIRQAVAEVKAGTLSQLRGRPAPHVRLQSQDRAEGGRGGDDLRRGRSR
jgi:hypothetical protein